LRELFLFSLRGFILLQLISTFIYADEVKEVKKGVVLTHIKDNLYRVKVFLNHQNSSMNQIKLFGSSTSFSTDIPIANRWRVVEARAVVQYTPSIALEPQRSFLSINLNKKVVRQFKLLNSKFMDLGESTVNIPIPVDELDRFNEFTIQVFQHYLLTGSENMSSAPEVWTELNLENSFVEFTIEMVDIEEMLSSILKYVFDSGNPLPNKINYPLPNFSNDTLYNYSFISSSIGNILKYREVIFSVTDRAIIDSKDNIIIGTKDEVQEILSRNKMDLKIDDDITIFANPRNPTTAIIVLTGENQEEIKKVLYSTTLFKLNLTDSNSKNIIDIEIPEKAKPYSAPEFIPFDRKIHFKDLGYKTDTFNGFYSKPLNLDFKLYPDLFFAKKSNTELSLDMLLPNSVKDDSILNIFVNGKYVTQKRVIEERESRTLKELLFLSPYSGEKLPTELLKDGENRITMQFKMIPFKDPKYAIYNSENLQATISENSYFQLPEADRWIEMADIRYFISSSYPYSIYPDLQDTAILLTDNRQESVEALMEVSFFLGKSIKYPSYHITVATEIDSSIEDKNLIVIGSYNSKFDDIFQKAPLKIEKDGYRKEISLDRKFSDELDPIKDEEDINSREQFIKSFESNKRVDHLITQFFQSPYNDEKSVLMFYGKGTNFYKEIRTVLMPEYNSELSGDLILSRLVGKQKEIFTFNIGDKYYIGDLDLIDKSRFYLSLNPLLFTITAILTIILFVYLLRKSLLLYKARYHDDAD